MTREKKRQYDRERYLRKREEIRAQRRQYYWEYYKKGLRKPRPRRPRSIRDHERYMENRDEILEKNRIYQKTHRVDINRRHREIYRRKSMERYINSYKQ